MKIKIEVFLIITLVFINLSCATLNREDEYCSILKEARRGETDFAFIKLKDYLREKPETTHKTGIRFAMCEYYLQTNNYRDAISELTKYIIDYPEDKSTVFARAILYKILIEYNGDPLVIEKLKKVFFSNYLFLAFSKSKAKSYTSIFNNTYKIIEYVDKIEVFKNNALFLKITP